MHSRALFGASRRVRVDLVSCVLAREYRCASLCSNVPPAPALSSPASTPSAASAHSPSLVPSPSSPPGPTYSRGGHASWASKQLARVDPTPWAMSRFGSVSNAAAGTGSEAGTGTGGGMGTAPLWIRAQAEQVWVLRAPPRLQAHLCASTRLVDCARQQHHHSASSPSTSAAAMNPSSPLAPMGMHMGSSPSAPASLAAAGPLGLPLHLSRSFAKRAKKWSGDPYRWVAVDDDKPVPYKQPNEGATRGRNHKRRYEKRDIFKKVQNNTRIAQTKAARKKRSEQHFLSWRANMARSIMKKKAAAAARVAGAAQLSS